MNPGLPHRPCSAEA